MKEKRNIMFRHVKTVLGMVLALGVLFCVFPLPVFADGNGVVDPTGKKEGYAAFLYDNITGLPTSEANAIAETTDGFIWIGSYGGLIRYDGNTFERYKSTTGIASVVSLFVDTRDRLWIGTNDNGAAVMDSRGNVTMYGKREGLQSASVRSFAEGQNGEIYIATTQGIAFVDSGNNLSAVDDSMINDKYVRRLEKGPDGIIYALTMDGDIFTLNNGSLGKYYSGEDLGIEDIHALAPDLDNPGYLYLGTKSSKIWYGSLDEGFPKNQRINVEPLEYINSIKCEGSSLWVCANNGVCVYKNDEVKMLENVPMNSNIENVMADYQGNLWFASSRQGVMKIVPNQFTDIFDKYGLNETVVNATCYYDDMLFIGTDSGLIVLNKEGRIESLRINFAVTASNEHLGYLELLSMLSGVRIRSIIKDSRDRLWISTYGKEGLVRYDHGDVKTFGPDDGMPSTRIRAVSECSDGSYLVACTGGLAVIRDDKIEKVYDASSGISNVEVLTVSEGTDGDMLAGTDGDGIYVVGPSGTKHLDTSNGLLSDVVMRIKKDVDHNVYWIVTSNSLAYMTPDYEIHTIENFPFSNNFDLYENSKGEIWVLSSNGIYVVSADDLIANGEIKPVFYGIANGLPAIATSNSYSFVTDEGVLYIAGSTGVAKVNIEKQFETVDDIMMTVPYIDADGVKVYPDSNGVINVSQDVKKITVYPYICTYTLMDPTVSYTLQGFDTESKTVHRTELTSVDYTNLKGGTYTFKMTISDAMGHGSNEYSITIVKQKALYEHAWFVISVVLLVLAVISLLVYTYVRKKTKKLLKKQEENRILIREIVEAFAKTIDMKDKYTNGHSKRVAEYTAMLTRELGYNEETVEKYYNIALLHDIGKIGVPGEVLNKPGKLDDNEFVTIKSHTSLGYNVLKDISIMPELSVGAESHHERPDGKGYPQGLSGDEIPRVAQIIGVADAFDAMYSNRPYRNRMNFEKVVSIIKGASGTQLTADVVDAFLRIVDRGGFRAPDDNGGGTTEDIDNIHKKFEKEQKQKDEEQGNDGKQEK
ncbi:MAG: HD domain-containing protein [Saccharofermentans sp.]|nr:HD domain-containing protein [Saccharofermentans sp.]